MKGAIEASKTHNSTTDANRISNGKGKKVLGPALSKRVTFEKCLSCGNANGASLLKCEFCEQNVCTGCCRVCVECEKNFCHVCSVIK